MAVYHARSICRNLQRKGQQTLAVSWPSCIVTNLLPTQINNLFGATNDHYDHKIEHDERKGTTSVTGITPSEASFFNYAHRP